MPTAGWWEALWPDPAGVLAKVGMRPGMNVIDLCSGDGWFTLQIAKVAHHVVAIDIDPDMLAVARHRLTAQSGQPRHGSGTCRAKLRAESLMATRRAICLR